MPPTGKHIIAFFHFGIKCEWPYPALGSISMVNNTG